MYKHEARHSLLGGQTAYQPITGGYHQREGYPVNEQTVDKTDMGMWRPTSTWSWTFVGIALVQAAAVLALEW